MALTCCGLILWEHKLPWTKSNRFPTGGISTGGLQTLNLTLIKLQLVSLKKGEKLDVAAKM